MPLYEVKHSGLERRAIADFATLAMYERKDLQRLLREQITALGEDLLIVAEEFGDWQDARRRIDLLALDKTGRLVVIELKRTDDGGHMELQAIRYAAMISSMNFGDILAAYAGHCAKYRPNEEVDPRAELEAFLELSDGAEEPPISTDVRIILVSADFGREITTTVLWLNGFEGMDIRCIRLLPYEIDNKVFLDIQQVLPLPEAADYQVRLRKKDAARERARTDGRDFTRYHIIVDGHETASYNKRNAVKEMLESLAAHGVRPFEFLKILPSSKLRSVDGQLHEVEDLKQALLSAYPQIDLPRWFTEYPLLDTVDNKTIVLSKMWGRTTEDVLKALVTAFPEAKVTFRSADPADT